MAVRRRAEWAWGGVAALTIIGAIAYGPQTAFERGLVGDYLWVGIAQLMVWGMDRAYRDTARLAQLQQASSAWQATQEALRAQRRSRVRFALAEAGPILSRVIATGGRIDQAERDGALLAEATLRDELRATRLLDDDVRGAIRRARERGATVTVIDDDALGDLDAAELAVVRAELASAIDETDADRIIVRTTPEAGAAVTIVGRVVGDRAPGDEDAVATWHEIRGLDDGNGPGRRIRHPGPGSGAVTRKPSARELGRSAVRGEHQGALALFHLQYGEACSACLSSFWGTFQMCPPP